MAGFEAACYCTLGIVAVRVGQNGHLEWADNTHARLLMF